MPEIRLIYRRFGDVDATVELQMFIARALGAKAGSTPAPEPPPPEPTGTKIDAGPLRDVLAKIAESRKKPGELLNPWD